MSSPGFGIKVTVASQNELESLLLFATFVLPWKPLLMPFLTGNIRACLSATPSPVPCWQTAPGLLIPEPQPVLLQPQGELPLQGAPSVLNLLTAGTHCPAPQLRVIQSMPGVKQKLEAGQALSPEVAQPVRRLRTKGCPSLVTQGRQDNPGPCD